MIGFQSLSLRSRLTLQWTAGFGVLLALASLVMFAATRSFQRADLDAQVRTLAATEIASATDDGRGVHLHDFPFGQVPEPPYAEKFAQVVGPGDDVAQSTANLEGAASLLDAAMLARARLGPTPVDSVFWRGREIRMMASPVQYEGASFVISVGLSTEAMHRTMTRVAWLLAGLWVVGLGLTAALGFSLASRALAPIDHITRRAASIAHGNFDTRLDPPAHEDEVGRMTALLNEMLDRLNEAIEANRRFAADASHELRSPLTAIAGEVDVALKRDRTPDEYRETLGLVRDQLRQMTELTENLMVLVRTQERASERLLHEVPVRSLVESALARLRHAAAARRIACVTSGCMDAVIYGDGRLYARVFDNLLRNALQYNRDGGSISVDVACVEADTGAWATDRIVTRVTNTGPAIPREDWERIFERFRRLDASRSRRTGGMGLGLAICRGIVRLYDGSIRVTASGERGTTLEIVLPGRRGLPVGTTAPPRAESPGQPEATV